MLSPGSSWKDKILTSGGWCYFPEESKQITKGDYSDADWLLPRFHKEFDKGLAKGLVKLLLKDGDSLTDCGAGVGQAGHILRALLPTLQYHGYDGAGNSEEFTNGYVRFTDLSYPMNLVVSDARLISQNLYYSELILSYVESFSYWKMDVERAANSGLGHRS